MKEIKCENCGNNNLKLYAGKYTCEHCGSIFIAEPNDGTVANRLGSFDIEDDVLIEYCGFDRIVEIPEGITCVAEGAFDHTSVRTIRCPLSLTKFEGSLEKARNLQTFEAPSLQKITEKLFSKNKTLKKVVLENIQKIPRDAFEACPELREVSIPNATSIGAAAFYKCPELKVVNMPNVKTIGGSAFQDCPKLEEVNIPNAKTIGKQAFQSSGICTLNAPKVKEIKDSAFLWCENLREINLPELETVAESGFASCDNLRSIVLPNLKSVGESAFSCEKLVHIDAPQLETLGHSAFASCRSLKKIVLPSVQSIDEFAFYDCDELTEVVCENATLVANEHGNYNQFIDSPKVKIIKLKEMPKQKKILKDFDSNQKPGGCYVATCVYGSYDCPQVWTLRRYRDNTLATTWFGRLFIHTYYAISPTIVKWFGNTQWFKNMWRNKLDKIVAKLQANGFESTYYKDKKW